MEEAPAHKLYDLEKRCALFAQKVRNYIQKLPRTVTNIEYSRQLARSSTSIGANYIEANESLGKKDFCLHIKISRKEAKESEYWLMLAEPNNGNLPEKESLIQEAGELRKIFGAILTKSLANSV